MAISNCCTLLLHNMVPYTTQFKWNCMTVCAVLFEIRFATYEKKSNDLIDTFVGIQNTMKNTQVVDLCILLSKSIEI